MRSISTKLILAFLLVSLTSLGLSAVLARWNTSQEFNDFIYNRNRSDLVASLEAYYQDQGSWSGMNPGMMLSPDHPMFVMAHGQPQNFILADTNGIIVVGRQGLSGTVLTAAELANGIPISQNGRVVGYLLVGRETFQANAAELDFIQRIGRLLLISSIGAATLALILAILLTYNLTRPIQELTQATRAISQGSLGAQVKVRGRDELSKLGLSFNQMSADLERSRNSRRQMTADIAHELRTPLSLIIGQSEAIHDGVLPPTVENLEVIREEAVRLEKLVDDLRTLSLADSGELSINTQPLAPGRFLEEMAALYKTQTLAKNIRLDVQIQPNLPEILFDPGRMTQVFTNLMENALHYIPRGGWLRLSASQTGQDVLLSVTDSGPGLPPEELERIFDRLYRVDPARNHAAGGSGLGLSIARSIVELHGGRMRAISLPDEGLTVQVILPGKSQFSNLS